MCRLLGLIANRPVDMFFSLERFKESAQNNPDGWGIGWYSAGKPLVFKQGLSAVDEDSDLPKLSKSVQSKIILSHVRYGTVGSKSDNRNAHPFVYNNWLFAHNGGVNRNHLLAQLSDNYRSEIEGETDSEVYFYWLLQQIELEKDLVKGIQKAISYVKEEDHSGLNFLLSDGKQLYAYRDCSWNEDYYTLYYLERDPKKYAHLENCSDETRELIRSKALSKEKAIVISSEILTTDEEWKAIELGSLLIINSDLSIEIQSI